MRPSFVPLFLLLAVGEAAAAARPNVVLVTLDTTRADRMGFLGSKAGLTTALDQLAARSVVFEQAYAQAPLTTVSHATILSGTYPQLHKVNDFGVPLPPDLPYLPDLLKAAGWQTAAFLGSLVLDARSGLAPGFDRGFDVYDAGFRTRRGKESRYQTIERRGAEVHEIAAYRTRELTDPRADLGPVDAVTFTSSSTVRGFLAGGPVPDGAKVVCIGPITAQTAREHGLQVAVVAEHYTEDGLIAALKAAFDRR